MSSEHDLVRTIRAHRDKVAGGVQHGEATGEADHIRGDGRRRAVGGDPARRVRWHVQEGVVVSPIPQMPGVVTPVSADSQAVLGLPPPPSG